jgi:hypothetical protein
MGMLQIRGCAALKKTANYAMLIVAVIADGGVRKSRERNALAFSNEDQSH